MCSFKLRTTQHDEIMNLIAKVIAITFKSHYFALGIFNILNPAQPKVCFYTSKANFGYLSHN